MDVAQAAVWRASAGVVVCRGASGHCPRRQGALARQGASEGPEALAPQGAASLSTVCAKGLGEALDTR